MDTNTYRIPTDRLDGLRAQLDKLARRADKKGLTPLTYTVSDPYAELAMVGTIFVNPYTDEQSDHRVEQLVEFVDVVINTDPPKLAGWNLLARVEHLRDEDNGVVNLFHGVPGRSVPEKYREVDSSNCDHCHKRLYRRDTFIVQHDDGRTAHVGSTCLKDFLGHDASRWLADATLLSNVIAAVSDALGGGDGCGRGSSVWGLKQIIELSADATMQFGFIGRMKAEDTRQISTKDCVLNHLDPKVKFTLERTDASQKLADNTLQWLSDLGDDESDVYATTDYHRNLAALARAGYVPWRGMGLAVSAPFAYQKYVGQMIERKRAAESKWVGVVGKKVGLDDPIVLTVIGAFGYEGMYGCGTAYKFTDPDSNQFIWFTTGNVDLEVGQSYPVIGTVKKHDNDRFNGGGQLTVLTRCQTDAKKVASARKRHAKKMAKV